MTYNPNNWYWIVAGNTTQVYESVSGTFVPVSNVMYQTWLAAGGVPTNIDTAANLGDVLARAKGPRPVDTSVLDGYTTSLATDVDLALGRVLFNHENRIRALEGKQPVTAQQFITAVKTLL
jgi:hypothetical protein